MLFLCCLAGGYYRQVGRSQGISNSSVITYVRYSRICALRSGIFSISCIPTCISTTYRNYSRGGEQINQRHDGDWSD